MNSAPQRALLPPAWGPRGSVPAPLAWPLASPLTPWPAANGPWEAGCARRSGAGGGRGAAWPSVSPALTDSAILSAVCLKPKLLGGCAWFIRSEAAYFLAKVRKESCREGEERLPREGVTRSSLTRRGTSAVPGPSRRTPRSLHHAGSRALARAGCKPLTSPLPEEVLRGRGRGWEGSSFLQTREVLNRSPPANIRHLPVTSRCAKGSR